MNSFPAGRKLIADLGWLAVTCASMEDNPAFCAAGECAAVAVSERALPSVQRR